jgi:hypothetical protein
MHKVRKDESIEVSENVFHRDSVFWDLRCEARHDITWFYWSRNTALADA